MTDDISGDPAIAQRSVPRSIRASVWRIFWLAVLIGHAALAGFWLWAAPGGFPPDHPHFWANEVVPWIALAAVSAALFASHRGRDDWLLAVLAAFPAAWAGAALCARGIFPVSARLLWLVPVAGAGVMAASLVRALRRSGRATWVIAMAASGAILGTLLPLSQRAPLASTRPLDAALPAKLEGEAVIPLRQSAQLGPHCMIHGADGSATIKAGGLTLFVNPLLNFLSRSPDRCWTLFARRVDREGPVLRLTSQIRGNDSIGYGFERDGGALFWVQRNPTNIVSIDASTELPRPVYSHLNSYCDVEVVGHRRLSVAFSPCPDAIVAIKPFDYPVGRPSQLAYLDASGVFHVAVATSGEKGPFHDLASGRLARGEPLSATLYDQGTARCRLTWDDWSAQVSTALSPTAGWGLPVNAIEFSLSGDSPSAPAELFVTLAGTSVGRGWDSVGHRPGVYRNRMKVEPINPNAATP